MLVPVMQWNWRKSSIDEEVASREWEVRAPYAKQFLKNSGAQIWLCQEATVEQCNDAMEWFPNMNYAGGVRYGNSPIFWDATKWRAEEGTLLEKWYPSDQVRRYMNIIRLTHIATGWGAWFHALHLAAGGPMERNEAALRQAQIKAMLADSKSWIDTHPYLQDGKPNIIVGGDINEYLSVRTVNSVRKIAYDRNGWKPLLMRLNPDQVNGDTYRTFNGWHKTSDLPRDSKHIDELWTSGTDLDSAVLKRACTDVYGRHASDHNAWVAKAVVTAPTLP
jgi:hypothetical protein